MLPHFGFGFYGFSGYDFVGFLLDRIRLVFLDLDIRFFVGSDLVFLV